MSEELLAPKPKEGEPYDVIIIGSGPSGLTSAIYSTRAALSTLVIGGYKWGGQLMLTTEVDNFPGFPKGIQGPELMENMKAQAERFGAEIKLEDVTSVDFSKSPFKVSIEDKVYEGKSVIIATGADTKWLNLPSEQKLIGRGISSCAPCDAAFFKDKKVIVVGGGDSAMEEALVLTRFATEVNIVHRRDSFRASEIMQKKVLNNPKIKVIWNSEITEILGEAKVEGVKIKDTQSQEITDMAIDGIFVAIGHDPMSKIFQGQIELDQKGYVKQIPNPKFNAKNENGEDIGNSFQTTTSVEGVFVAGDVHDLHYKQAITASAFGCMAAMDVEKWIEMQN
jgi:thioredoxin reductase (NADPH)